MRDFIRADGFTGEHNPTAVLLAAGGPIRHVPQRGQLSVLDVAPLFAYLAGVAIPDDLEGRLPEQWLDADALAARPPRRVDADSLPRLPAPVAPDSADGESDVIERLRSMGYVE